MDKINKVSILGAGAMGAFFASRFFEAPDFSTTIVAGGKYFERLKNEGLVVDEKQYQIPLINPGEASSPADLVIVALKNHHLKEAVHDLKNLVNDSTIIISVMNGLDSEEYIGAVYGKDKLLYAVSVGIDALREGNKITYTNPGKHYFGEAENSEMSKKVLKVQEAFDRANIPRETPEDMLRILWWKFMINVGMNQASAVMRAPYGVFQKSKDAQTLMEALMLEVIDLAKVIGINLSGDDINDWYSVLKTLSPQGKTSMLQDIEAGRKTEIEIFGGKVVDLGQAHGISTPVNRTVFHIIKVLEEHTN
ncbi:ketopantoate reductase family protein [Thermodesulfobacteriota bacterium]